MENRWRTQLRMISEELREGTLDKDLCRGKVRHRRGCNTPEQVKAGRTSLLFLGLKVTRTHTRRGQGGRGCQSGAETVGGGMWPANGGPEGTLIKRPDLTFLPLSATL